MIAGACAKSATAAACRAADGPATAGYPSILQTRDDRLHVSYTYELNAGAVKADAAGRRPRNCIKHASFTEAWVMAGD